MIYKYTKCESVIAKIMADMDSTEVRQRITDIKEWIFEAVDKIGAPMQYVTKESGVNFPVLKIQDYQVPIPADLQVLDGVAFSLNQDGPWKPMDKSTSMIHQRKDDKQCPPPIPQQIPHDENNKTIDISTVEEIHEHQPAAKKAITSQSQLYTQNYMKYVDKIDPFKTLEYFIKPGWIVTNINKGYIKLIYKTIATDERGYPLIPDTSAYQEAVYWYVLMKLSFAKWMKGTLGGKGVNAGQNMYTFIHQQWNFYRNQAYAEAMMPTADDMRNIKNEWNKLLPDWEEDKHFFSTIGKEEITYNDYYHGY